MCEILIFARNTPLTGDLSIDNFRYKRGDVVTIKEDGAIWGRKASRTEWVEHGHQAIDWVKTFILLKIPGLAVSRVLALLTPDITILPLANGPEESVNAKRLRFFDIDATPAQIRTKIGSDFEITVTKAQVRNFIKRKSDGAVYDPGFDL